MLYVEISRARDRAESSFARPMPCCRPSVDLPPSRAVPAFCFSSKKLVRVERSLQPVQRGPGLADAIATEQCADGTLVEAFEPVVQAIERV